MDLAQRFLEFSGNILIYVKQLPIDICLRSVIDQLIRSSTSIGANYAEAQAAESRADFLHKVRISLKEAYETHYWLCVLRQSKIIMVNSDFEKLLQEAYELKLILSRVVSNTQRNS